MKYNSTSKVLLAAIVCASVALSSFAQTGEVYSLNVVGFQKLAVTSGFAMVSTPFARAPATLDSVIGPQLRQGKSSTLADNVLVWNRTNQTYDTYWLRTGGVWMTQSGAFATNTALLTDSGFWIRNRGTTGQTVVVSGDVTDYSVSTNVCVPGFSLISYSYSSEIDINRSSLTNGRNGKSSTLADNVMLWDAAAQAYLTYWLRTDRVWRTQSGALASNVMVGGGRGFWYRNRATTNFYWVEAKPYTL